MRSRLLTHLDKDSDDAVREEFAWKYVRQAFMDPLVLGLCLFTPRFCVYTLHVEPFLGMSLPSCPFIPLC